MSDITKPLATIFADAIVDHTHGAVITDCFYLESSEEQEACLEGWHEANRLDEDGWCTS